MLFTLETQSSKKLGSKRLFYYIFEFIFIFIAW